MPFKSSDNMDQGIKKKLRRLDGCAVPIETDSVEGDAGGFSHDTSQSLGNEINGLRDENNGSIRACQTQRSNGSERVLSTDDNMKVHTQVSPSIEGKTNADTTKVYKSAGAPANVAQKSTGFPNEKIDIGSVCVVSSAGAGLPFEGFVMDEKQLKRERRKQANRESARRSRLRKQAEVEELMTRYESLNMENTALKTELDQLQEDSEKLRLEKAELMEKLKNTQLGQQEGMVSAKD